VTESRNRFLDLREQVRRELGGVVIGYEEPLDLLLVAAESSLRVLTHPSRARARED